MKKILSFIIVFLIAVTASAQSFKIGFFSYDAALKSMPEYVSAMNAIDELAKQYDNEVKSAEKEFSEKYELFLEQQASMAKAIREKRQSELQLLMDRNVSFREESSKLLSKAKDDAMKPIIEKLNAAVKQLGLDGEFAAIINTDSNAAPFIHPAVAEDLNATLQNMLK